MRRLAWVLLLMAGCSGPWKSDELGVQMELPRGYDKPTVSNGVADFGGGLKIVRVEKPLPEIGSIPHDEILKLSLAAVPGVDATTPTSRREGSIGGAKVLRFDLKDGSSRGLAYVLPRGNSYLVLYASPTQSDAQQRLDRIERAFGTMKVSADK